MRYRRYTKRKYFQITAKNRRQEARERACKGVTIKKFGIDLMIARGSMYVLRFDFWYWMLLIETWDKDFKWEGE